ncbi:general substrate transporter [Dipodascopsis uninucleata]
MSKLELDDLTSGPKTGNTQEHTRLEDVLPASDKSWYKRRNLLLLNLLLLCPIMSSTTVGYDGSMLNGLQSQSQWQDYFKHPTGYRLGHLSAAPTFGQILAFIPGGYISDRFGRRAGIAVGASLVIVAAAIQAAANSYGMFFAARLIIGFGCSISVNPSPTLLSELTYPTHRGIVTTSYNIMWYSGAVLAAWITYGTYWMGDTDWSWRIPSLLQAFFPVIQLCMIYFVPESPRYLIFKDKISEARKILVKYHADGDERSPLVDFEMAEIIAAIQFEKSQKTVSYAAFFKKPNSRRLLITVAVPFMQQMSGNGLVSYYLALVLNSIGITSSSQQLIINGGLMIYNFGITIILTPIIPKFGRRQVFLTSTTLMTITYVIWTVLSAINQERNFEDPSLGRGVLAMIFLYNFAYNIGLMGLPYLYLTEVLPYYLRSKGMAITQLMNGCTSLYNGYVNSIAMDAINWKYYIVYCCIIAGEGIFVFFFFPETRGRTLEEVAEVFDGPEASASAWLPSKGAETHHDEVV